MGRLRLLVVNCRLIAQDPWVLESTQGHKLDLLSSSAQGKAPEQPHLSPELESCMQKELSRLIQKGSVVKLPNLHLKAFLIFLGPKKDGSHRPIVAL